MDKNELWRLIQKEEKEYDRNKFMRMIVAILLYSSIWFLIFHLQGQHEGASFLLILGDFAACIFIGGITFFFNLLVFHLLFSKSDSENRRIEYLKKQLKEMEQENNH